MTEQNDRDEAREAETATDATRDWDDPEAWSRREERLSLRTTTVNLVEALIKAGYVDTVSVSATLREVHDTLTSLGAPAAVKPAPEPAVEPLKPAVPVEKSITDAAIISLIDGKPYQALARHLTRNGHTPASYRAAFDLPNTYPMVAPGYARKRAEMAKAQGLGRRTKQPAAA